MRRFRSRATNQTAREAAARGEMTEASEKPASGGDPPAAVGQPGEAPEPEEGSSSFTEEMGRLFIIPAVIVALSIGVFLLFGWVASEGKGAREYLQEVRQASAGRRWQAAFEFSRILVSDEAARKDPRLGAEVAALLGDPKTDDPLIRRYLILALQEIGDPAHAPAVEAALDDPDQTVRLYAARAMAGLGEGVASPGLLAMASDDDPALRKMAIYALGRSGDTGAVAAILPHLDDPVVDVRFNAALALAVLGDRSGVDVIRNMLDGGYLERIEGITESQKIEARLNAIQAAYRLADPELKPMVEKLSRNDGSLKVRDAALRSLQAWPRSG